MISTLKTGLLFIYLNKHRVFKICIMLKLELKSNSKQHYHDIGRPYIGTWGYIYADPNQSFFCRLFYYSNSTIKFYQTVGGYCRNKYEPNGSLPDNDCPINVGLLRNADILDYILLKMKCRNVKYKLGSTGGGITVINGSFHPRLNTN